MLNFFKIGKLRNLKYMPQFFLDTKVPYLKKLESLVYIIFILSPLDFMPDIVLGLGQIDDLIILFIFLNRILYSLDRYKNNVDRDLDDSIEVDYKIKDKEE